MCGVAIVMEGDGSGNGQQQWCNGWWEGNAITMDNRTGVAQWMMQWAADNSNGHVTGGSLPPHPSLFWSHRVAKRNYLIPTYIVLFCLVSYFYGGNGDICSPGGVAFITT